MTKIKIALSLMMLLAVTNVQAQDSYNCSASTGCQVVVRPGMGWHVKLGDLVKGAKYSCHIDGIAALGNLNQEDATKLGIESVQLNRIDYKTAILSFDTTNLNVLPGYLFFDMENSSDIPVTENVSCDKA